jgi:hypothetical protein
MSGLVLGVLRDVPGVTGAVLIDDSDYVVESWLPADVAEEQILAATRVARNAARNHFDRYRLDSFVWTACYARGLVTIRGIDRALLVLMAARTLDPKLVAIVCDMVRDTYQTHASIPLAKKSAPSTRLPRPGMSWQLPPGTKPKKASVGLEVMLRLLYTFRKYRGSDAQEILEVELKRRQLAPYDVDVMTFGDLVSILGASIDDPILRERFRMQALGDDRSDLED